MLFEIHSMTFGIRGKRSVHGLLQQNRSNNTHAETHAASGRHVTRRRQKWSRDALIPLFSGFAFCFQHQDCSERQRQKERKKRKRFLLCSRKDAYSPGTPVLSTVKHACVGTAGGPIAEIEEIKKLIVIFVIDCKSLQQLSVTPEQGKQGKERTTPFPLSSAASRDCLKESELTNSRSA